MLFIHLWLSFFKNLSGCFRFSSTALVADTDNITEQTQNDLKVARWGFEQAQNDEQEALALLDRFRQLSAGATPTKGLKSKI